MKKFTSDAISARTVALAFLWAQHSTLCRFGFSFVDISCNSSIIEGKNSGKAREKREWTLKNQTESRKVEEWNELLERMKLHKKKVVQHFLATLSMCARKINLWIGHNVVFSKLSMFCHFSFRWLSPLSCLSCMHAIDCCSHAHCWTSLRDVTSIELHLASLFLSLFCHIIKFNDKVMF